MLKNVNIVDICELILYNFGNVLKKWEEEKYEENTIINNFSFSISVVLFTKIEKKPNENEFKNANSDNSSNLLLGGIPNSYETKKGTLDVFDYGNLTEENKNRSFVADALRKDENNESNFICDMKNMTSDFSNVERYLNLVTTTAEEANELMYMQIENFDPTLYPYYYLRDTPSSGTHHNILSVARSYKTCLLRTDVSDSSGKVLSKGNNQISTVIPIALMQNCGRHLYIGEEYGFFVSTESKTSQVSNHSTVMIFKVDNNACDVNKGNNSLSDKSAGDYISTKITPVFEEEYMYIHYRNKDLIQFENNKLLIDQDTNPYIGTYVYFYCENNDNMEYYSIDPLEVTDNNYICITPDYDYNDLDLCYHNGDNEPDDSVKMTSLSTITELMELDETDNTFKTCENTYFSASTFDGVVSTEIDKVKKPSLGNYLKDTVLTYVDIKYLSMASNLWETFNNTKDYIDDCISYNHYSNKSLADRYNQEIVGDTTTAFYSINPTSQDTVSSIDNSDRIVEYESNGKRCISIMSYCSTNKKESLISLYYNDAEKQNFIETKDYYYNSYPTDKIYFKTTILLSFHFDGEEFFCRNKLEDKQFFPNEITKIEEGQINEIKLIDNCGDYNTGIIEYCCNEGMNYYVSMHGYTTVENKEKFEILDKNNIIGIYEIKESTLLKVALQTDDNGRSFITLKNGYKYIFIIKLNNSYTSAYISLEKEQELNFETNVDGDIKVSDTIERFFTPTETGIYSINTSGYNNYNLEIEVEKFLITNYFADVKNGVNNVNDIYLEKGTPYKITMRLDDLSKENYETLDIEMEINQNDLNINPTIKSGNTYTYYYKPIITHTYDAFVNGSSDTKITIYDNDNNVIASNNDLYINGSTCQVFSRNTKLYKNTNYKIVVESINSEASELLYLQRKNDEKIVYNLNTDFNYSFTCYYNVFNEQLFNIYTSGSGDTKITIYDENNNQIAYNDDLYSDEEDYNAFIMNIKLNKDSFYKIVVESSYEFDGNLYISPYIIPDSVYPISIENENSTVKYFRPSETRKYDIFTTGSEDTRIIIYDENNSQIAYNEDLYSDENNYNGYIQNILLNRNVQYKIIIESYNGYNDVYLKINKIYEDVQDTIIPNVNVRENELYTYYYTSLETYVFDIFTSGSADTKITVYDEDNNQIAYNDDLYSDEDDYNAYISNIVLTRNKTYKIVVASEDTYYGGTKLYIDCHGR